MSNKNEEVVLVEVRTLMWKNEIIRPSGYRFVNCRFDGCTFIGAGGEFINCQINAHILPEFTEQMYLAMRAWREVDMGDVGYGPGTEELRQMSAIYEAVRRELAMKAEALPSSFLEEAMLHMKRQEFEAWYYPPVTSYRKSEFKNGHYDEDRVDKAFQTWLITNKRGKMND